MAEVSASPASSTAEAQPLPKLSPAEFRNYNILAVKMDYFHNNFRNAWTTLYTAAAKSKRPAGMSLRQFLSYGLDFCRHITAHHDIEEVHIFPMLGARMPIFQNNELMKQHHKLIHAGLERLEAYLTACRSGDREYRAAELEEIMASFNDMLWTHLDEEVKQLGAENMRKYWTQEEIARMRF